MNRRQLLLSGIATVVCAPVKHIVSLYTPDIGILHNARVFPKALSAEQVRYLYANPYDPLPL